MSWIAEVKAKHTIVSAFSLLGMQGRRMRYGPCPACGAVRTAQDSRPPVRASGRHSWWCNACQQNGDILDLVSYSLWGYSSKQADFKELKKFFLDRDHIKPPEYKPDDNMSQHPPQGQVKWLLDEAYMMDDHQTPDEVWDYIHKRGINPIGGSARCANKTLDHGQLRWVSNSSGKKMPWWPTAWVNLYPIILPMYDHNGQLRSLHGRSVDPNARRKTSAPLGFSAKGLFFMNQKAIHMCRGEYEPKEVWIVEGEIDFMSLEQFTDEEDITVIGIKAGSLNDNLLPIPPNAKIFICTDPDDAGDRYAQKIIRQYSGNTLMRVRHG
tara:strand:- start:2552 stop:3523 length:972 start_codon:yes stop_codon:yes gene_type:complete